MTINRRDFLVASGAAGLLMRGATTASGQPKQPPRAKRSRTDGRTVTVYTTADKTAHRISQTDTLTFKPNTQPPTPIMIDPTKTFQTFLGIGGALTDASAEVFAKLPKDKQQKVLEAYFDPHKGIGYTLGRTSIHSCDFSSGSYTYVTEGDKALTSFNVEHDRQFRIPFIKQAIAAAGGKLTLFASPWSPPAFMKDNNSMLNGGKLKAEYYQSWASYYPKFIKAYEKEGIPIWGITIQNEPLAVQKWESCIYTAEEERDFLKNFLGPAMKRAGLGDKKIIAWDHNRDVVYQRASTILSDPAAAKYLWGIGYHWYEGLDGGDPMFENVKLVRDTFPNTNLIFTEGCLFPFKPARMRDWQIGEMYGRSMINDFNCGTVGWTDWNILLDDAGGPNHVNNFCFSPMHADRKTGELTYLSSYHYIGHFSKFIRPGAKRIACSSSHASLIATAFVNKDGKTAAVVMNRSAETLPYSLWIDGYAAETTSLPHSIQTLTF